MILRILFFALIAFGVPGFIFHFSTETPFYLLNAVSLFIAFVIVDFTLNPALYASAEDSDDE